MNNAKITTQLELAHRALEQLTGAGVLIRRMQLGQAQGQPTIVCIATHPADYRMEWCEGCRLVWTSADEDDAEGGDIAAGDQFPAMRRVDADTWPPVYVQQCGHCGCTDLDACHHDDGQPCFWVQPGLCSVCAEGLGVDVDAHRMYGAEASVEHALPGGSREGMPR